MARLNARRLERFALHPGGKQIEIKPWGSATAEHHDVGRGQYRRKQGEQKLREERQPVVAVQRHGQYKYGNHAGNDHRHAKVAFKSERVPG